MSANTFCSAGGAAFTCDRTDWETPKNVFNELDEEFQFTLDAAADERNKKVDTFYSISDDSLSQPWNGRVFCNPPYGRELNRWVEKAYTEYLNNIQCECVVLLIPARTDTSYWHDYIFGHAVIRFLRGRVKFEINGEPQGPAPFPSAVVVYGGKDEV